MPTNAEPVGPSVECGQPDRAPGVRSSSTWLPSAPDGRGPVALRGVDLRHDLLLETLEVVYPLGDDPAAALPAIVDAFAPDVIHSHNLPDALTVLALDTVRMPVIHDVHDMQSLRRTPYEDGFPEPADALALERRAVEESAAIVTVSPELVDELAARYRLPRHVLPYANYALGRDLPAELPPPCPLVGPPRLVYGLSSATTGTRRHDYRDRSPRPHTLHRTDPPPTLETLETDELRASSPAVA